MLVVAAAWTIFVWVNRLVNLRADDRSAAFIAVHIGLAIISLGAGRARGRVGWRLARGAGAASRP